MEKHGQTRTDQELRELAIEVIGRRIKEVLDYAWQGTFTTKSDFARSHADWIALSASLDLITVMTSETTWTRNWMITEKGLIALEEITVILGEQNEPH